MRWNLNYLTINISFLRYNTTRKRKYSRLHTQTNTQKGMYGFKYPSCFFILLHARTHTHTHFQRNLFLINSLSLPTILKRLHTHTLKWVHFLPTYVCFCQLKFSTCLKHAPHLSTTSSLFIFQITHKPMLHRT